MVTTDLIGRVENNERLQTSAGWFVSLKAFLSCVQLCMSRSDCYQFFCSNKLQYYTDMYSDGVFAKSVWVGLPARLSALLQARPCGGYVASIVLLSIVDTGRGRLSFMNAPSVIGVDEITVLWQIVWTQFHECLRSRLFVYHLKFQWYTNNQGKAEICCRGRSFINTTLSTTTTLRVYNRRAQWVTLRANAVINRPSLAWFLPTLQR